MTFHSGPDWQGLAPPRGSLRLPALIFADPIAPAPLKVLFDRVASAALLLLFSPLILGIGLLLLLVEGAPVLFAHERVGRDGQIFRCLKFRTMARDAQARLPALLANDPQLRAEWQAGHKLQDDPRVHRIGRILRRTSLDELPQLWNVLVGDMSLVGPRPVTVDEAHLYGTHFAEYMAVRPGVTGLWQINGRSDTSYGERVAMDVDYVHNHGLLRDLGILARTAWIVLRGKGAC